MFIKEIVKKSKKSGNDTVQHRLVESHRTPLGPRQKTILHLGTLDLPKKNWKELADTIESLVTYKDIITPVSRKLLDIAKHYASIIVRRRLVDLPDTKIKSHKIKNNTKKSLLTLSKKEKGPIHRQKKLPDSESGKSSDYETIDIFSLQNSDALPIGAEHIAFSQIKEYGLLDYLKELNFNKRQIMAATVLIAGRLIHPASEKETARWARQSSGLAEFLSEDFSKLSDQALHRAGDLLWDNREALESYLAQKASHAFSLENAILLYDLTNTYFETSKKASQIALFGKSKEKRSDCPLVTLALVVDGEGFPKLCKVFKGNVSEPATLSRILEGLASMDLPKSLHRKTVVIDAGIASMENLDLLRQKGYDYIAVSRQRSFEENFWQEMEWQDIELKHPGSVLSIKSQRTDGEVFLLCHSNRKESTDSAILQSHTRRFEEAVSELDRKLKCQKRRKPYEKIMEQIGRIKEKYQVGHYYDITVSHENGFALSVSLERKESLSAREGMLGNYVLRTSREDLADEEISRIHRVLTRIEQSFKWMKTDLGIRPVHHQLDKRIGSHLFITVLGYHIMAPILYRIQKKAGITNSWRTIKNIVASHQRVTTTFMTQDGYRIDLRNSTIPTSEQNAIYKALGITSYPLKSLFSKVKIKKGV